MYRELLIEKYSKHSGTGKDLCGNEYKFWHNKHRHFHRNYNLPAISFSDGRGEWWKNGYAYKVEFGHEVSVDFNKAFMTDSFYNINLKLMHKDQYKYTYKVIIKNKCANF